MIKEHTIIYPAAQSSTGILQVIKAGCAWRPGSDASYEMPGSQA